MSLISLISSFLNVLTATLDLAALQLDGFGYNRGRQLSVSWARFRADTSLSNRSMLCIKPYLLWKEMKRVQREGYSGLPGNEDDYGSQRVKHFSSNVDCKFSFLCLNPCFARVKR
jgi:hypothetical protein